MAIERVAATSPAIRLRGAEAPDAPAGGSGAGMVVVPEAVVEVKSSVAQPTLQGAVDQINRALADAQRELAFSIDESSGRTVVRVIDASSGDVVRQMPSDEVLRLADRLSNGLRAQSIGVDQWS